MGSTRPAPVLIIGNWCRPLAQSAHRAGIEAVVFDLFADADTRRYARAAHRVAGADQSRIDLERAAALAAQHAGECTTLVYAAGFEHAPEQLLHIAAGRTIFGNSAASVRAVKQPAALGALLQQAGLPYPETRLQAPEQVDAWLVKQAGEQGGAHVLPLTPGYRPHAGDYFQRHIDGTPCSALFLTDGAHVRIIGYSEQLTAAVGDAPYCYGGAVSHAPMEAAIRSDIESKLAALARAAGLIGLNGIDFVVNGSGYFVLEINPRPPATLDLYDEDCPGGLLAWHMDACNGKVAQMPLHTHNPRAHAVVYARRAGQVPGDFIWPHWCSDLEPPGAQLAVHTPVCMVHAAAATHVETRALLLERRQTVLQALAVD